jgi:hypothetical protein
VLEAWTGARDQEGRRLLQPHSGVRRLPPGLSTLLFLRLGDAPWDSLCQLIYPASGRWHPHSTTDLILCNKEGVEIAKVSVALPCSGSLLWR